MKYAGIKVYDVTSSWAIIDMGVSLFRYSGITITKYCARYFRILISNSYLNYNSYVLHF